MAPTNRVAVLALLALSLAILIPGLFQPVLIIRGVLTREGIAAVAPEMLEKGLTEETVATLQSMMNPTVVAMLQFTGGDLRKALIDRLSPQLTSALQESGDLEVYQQTRSIVGSVQNLYELGSPVPATLILLFSVIVPLTKAAMVGWAMFARNTEHRRRTLRFVEMIAKWSMADVFVVGLFITYLAAEATKASTGEAASLVAFDATFGPGFYWFAAYCIVSLASQQYTRYSNEALVSRS